MTCTEKLKLEHPEYVAQKCNPCSGEYLSDVYATWGREKLKLEHKDCPSSFDYLEDPDWCTCSDDACRRCWDREIPVEDAFENKTF